MKNVAVVVGGGSGTRMGQDIPKQFINVFDKPVLIYTLESFQRPPTSMPSQWCASTAGRPWSMPTPNSSTSTSSSGS
ncbi:MAG: 2-C-methyl-D-erythritol 4-phosphate cytidylyltransferase [Bifidobacterium dentium]